MVAPSKPAFDNFENKLRDKPILPLEDEEETEIDDTRSTTFKLRTIPADADSAKYAFKVPIVDGSTTPRQVLKWGNRMTKVFTGLGMDNPVDRNNLLKEMVSGASKTAYDNAVNASNGLRHLVLQRAAVQNLVRDNVNGGTAEAFVTRRQGVWDGIAKPQIDGSDVRAGIQAVIEQACPYKALEKQKRYMRRKMRKPSDMTTRTYVNHLLRINNEEIPNMPPFNGDNQKLAPDEIIDIVCYGIPRSWMKKMDEHDFDPFTANIQQLIAFCERMESSEDFEKGSNVKQAQPSKKTKKHKSTRNNGGGSSGKWCHYHETDSHDTKECEVLKKLKASKSSGSGSDSKPPFKNKTWKRKSDDAKSYTKKELSAIVEKASKAAVKAAMKSKKECNAVAKRKNDSSDDDSASSDDCSINMLDQKMKDVDKALADFDFGNKSDDKSDGEISV